MSLPILPSTSSFLPTPPSCTITSNTYYPSFHFKPLAADSKLIFSPSKLTVSSVGVEDEIVYVDWPLVNSSTYFEFICPVNCENLNFGLIKKGFVHGQPTSTNIPFCLLWTFRTSTPRVIGFKVDFESGELRCWLNDNFQNQKVYKLEQEVYYPCVKIKERGNVVIFNGWALESGRKIEQKERFGWIDKKNAAFLNLLHSEKAELITSNASKWVLFRTSKSYKTFSEISQDLSLEFSDQNLEKFLSLSEKTFALKQKSDFSLPQKFLQKNIQPLKTSEFIQLLENISIGKLDNSPATHIFSPIIKSNYSLFLKDLTSDLESTSMENVNELKSKLESHLYKLHGAVEVSAPTELQLELINDANLLISDSKSLKLFRPDAFSNFNIPPSSLKREYPSSLESLYPLDIKVKDLLLFVTEFPWGEFISRQPNISWLVERLLNVILAQNTLISSNSIDFLAISLTVKEWKLLLDNMTMFLNDRISNLEEKLTSFTDPKNNEDDSNSLSFLPFAEQAELIAEPQPKKLNSPLTSLETLYILEGTIQKLDNEFKNSLMSLNGETELYSNLYPQKNLSSNCALTRLSTFTSVPNNRSFSLLELAENGIYNIQDNLEDFRHFLAPRSMLSDLRIFTSKKSLGVVLKKLLPQNRMFDALGNSHIGLSDVINALPAMRHGEQEIAKVKKGTARDWYVGTFSKNGKVVLWNTELCLFKVFDLNLREKFQSHPVCLEKKEVIKENSSAVEEDLFLFGDASIFEEDQIPPKKPLAPIPPCPPLPPTLPPFPPEVIPDPAMLEALYNMGFPMDLAKKALIRTKNGDLSVTLDTILQIQEEETKLPKPTIKSNVSLLKPTWKCNACTLQNTNSLTNNCSICTTQAPIEAYYTEEELKQEEEGKKKTEEVIETPQNPVQDEQKEEVAPQPQVNEEEKKKEELENKKRDIIEKGEMNGEFLITLENCRSAGVLVGAVFAKQEEADSILKIRRLGFTREYIAKCLIPTKPESPGFINKITKEHFREETFNAIEKSIFAEDCRFNVEVLQILFSADKQNCSFETLTEFEFILKNLKVIDTAVRPLRKAGMTETFELLVLTQAESKLKLLSYYISVNNTDPYVKPNSITIDSDSEKVLFSIDQGDLRVEDLSLLLSSEQILFILAKNKVLVYLIESLSFLDSIQLEFNLITATIIKNSVLVLLGAEGKKHQFDFSQSIKQHCSVPLKKITSTEVADATILPEPEKLNISELKALRELLNVESVATKAKNPDRMSVYDSKKRSFHKNSWNILGFQDKNEFELELLEPANILQLNLELRFDFNPLNIDSLEKTNLIKDGSVAKGQVESPSNKKPLNFSGILGDQDFASESGVKVSEPTTYIPLRVAYFEGASYNKTFHVTRMLLPSQNSFISNYSNSIFVFEHLHEKLMSLENVIIWSRFENASGGHPIGSGLVFLLDNLAQLELTRPYHNMTIQEYKKVFKNKLIRKEYEPVAFFSMEESETLALELDIKRTAKYLVLKPNNFREKPNNYTQFYKISSVDVKFIGVTGSVLDHENSQKEIDAFLSERKHQEKLSTTLAEHVLSSISIEILNEENKWISLENPKEHSIFSEKITTSSKASWETLAEAGFPVSSNILLEIRDNLFKKTGVQAFRVVLNNSEIRTKEMNWKLKTISSEVIIPSIQSPGKYNMSSIRQALLDQELYQVFNAKLVRCLTNEELSIEFRRNVCSLLNELLLIRGSSLLKQVYHDLDLLKFLRINILADPSSHVECLTFLRFLAAFNDFPEKLLKNCYKILKDILKITVSPSGLTTFLNILNWCNSIDSEAAFFEILSSLRNIIGAIKDYRNPHYNLLRIVFGINQLSLESELFSIDNIKNLRAKGSSGSTEISVSPSDFDGQDFRKKTLKSKILLSKTNFGSKMIIDLFDLCQINEVYFHFDKTDICQKIFIKLWSVDGETKTLILSEYLKEHTVFQLNNLAYQDELTSTAFKKSDILNTIAFTNLNTQSRYLILQLSYTCTPPFKHFSETSPVTFNIVPEFYGENLNINERSLNTAYSKYFPGMEQLKFLQNLSFQKSGKSFKMYETKEKDQLLIEEGISTDLQNKQDVNIHDVMLAEEQKLKTSLAEAQAALIGKLQQNRTNTINQAEKSQVVDLCSKIEELQLKLFMIKQKSNGKEVKFTPNLDFLYSLIVKLSQMLRKIDRGTAPRSWRQNEWIQNEQGKQIALEFFENLIIFEQIAFQTVGPNPSSEILSLLTECLIDNLTEREWQSFIIIILRCFLSQNVNIATSPLDHIFSHNRTIQALDQISIPNGEILCYLALKLGIKYDFHNEKIQKIKPFLSFSGSLEDKKKQEASLLRSLASLLLLLHKGFSKIPFEIIDPKKITHKGSYCFSCGQTKHISGPRLKCLNCPNLDCCSLPSCEQKHLLTYPNHVFIIIEEPLPLVPDRRNQPEPFALAPVFTFVDPSTDLHGVLCDNCQKEINGIRYMCGNCEEFSLCSQCYKTRVHTKYHVFIKLDRKIMILGNSTPKCLIQVLDPLLYPLKATITEGEPSPIKKKISKGISREIHLIKEEEEGAREIQEEIKAIGLKKSISSPIREGEYLKFMKKSGNKATQNGLKPVEEEDESTGLDMTRLDFEESLRITVQICLWICEGSSFGEIDKTYLLGLSFDLLLEILKLNSMIGIKEFLQSSDSFLRIFLHVLKLDSASLLGKLSLLLEQLSSPKNAPLFEEKLLAELNQKEKQRLLNEKNALDELRVLLVYHLQTLLQWVIDFSINPSSSSMYSSLFKDQLPPPIWLSHVSFVLDYFLLCSEKVAKVISQKKRENPMSKPTKRKQSNLIEEPLQNKEKENALEVEPLPPGILKSVSMPMDPEKLNKSPKIEKRLEIEPKSIEKVATLSVNTAVNLIDLLLPQAERNPNARLGYNLSKSAKLWSLVFKAILKVKINLLTEARIYDSLIGAFLVANEEIQHTMFPEILHITQNMMNQGNYQREFCGSVLGMIFSFIKQNMDLSINLTTFNTISFNLLKGWLDILLTKSTPKPEEFFTKPFEKAFCKLNMVGAAELFFNSASFLLKHANFGGKEGVQLATETDLMKLNLADDMLKLLITAEGKSNQLAIFELFGNWKSYENELRTAIRSFIHWYLLNQTKETLTSPGTDMMLSLSTSVQKLFVIIRDYEDIVKLAIKELITICKLLDENILKKFRNSQLPTFISLALNEQNCKLLDNLLELWVFNDTIAQYLAFEVKGFEFLLDRMGLSESEKINSEDSGENAKSLLMESDLMDYLQKSTEKEATKEKEEKSAALIKYQDLKEEEFATKITIINLANQHWSGIPPDWSLNKKGARGRVLFFQMNGQFYSEYSLLLELDRVCEMKQLKLGINTVWTDYNDKVLGVPSSILLEGGINKTSLLPLGTLELINDEGYSNYSVKVFKKNFASLRSNVGVSDVESNLKSLENRPVKFIKLTFRRPVVTFIENLSMLCNKTYRNICVGIGFLTISGYDVKKINGDIQNSIIEHKKFSTIQVLGRLCNPQFTETLTTLSNRADVISKIKSHFELLSTLLVSHENWLSSIFLAISHNPETGDFLIDRFLNAEKSAPAHAKMILDIILTNPSTSGASSTLPFARLVKLFQFLRRELNAQLGGQLKSVQLSGLVNFIESFNSGLRLIAGELNIKGQLVLPCDCVDIHTIIKMYEASSGASAKSLARMVVSLLYPWKPVELAEDLLIPTLLLIFYNMIENKKISLLELFAQIIAGSSKAALWLLEESRLTTLTTLLMDSLDASDSNFECQKVCKALIQILNAAAFSEEEIKEKLRSQGIHLNIYTKIKSTNPQKILKINDGDTLTLLVDFMKSLVLGSSVQEKNLAEVLINDLSLLETRRDMLFVTKLLIPLLNAEALIPLSLHAYEPNSKKYLIEGRRVLSSVPLVQNKQASIPPSLNTKLLSTTQKNAFETVLKSQLSLSGITPGKFNWENIASYDTDGNAAIGDTIFQKVLKNAPFAIIMAGKNGGKDCVCGVYCGQPMGDTPVEDYEYEKVYNIAFANENFMFYYEEEFTMHFNIPVYPGQNYVGHYHVLEDGTGLSFHFNGQERMFISFQAGTASYVDFNLYDMKPMDILNKNVPADIPADFQFKKCEFWIAKPTANIPTKAAENQVTGQLAEILCQSWHPSGNPLSLYRPTAVYMVPSEISVEKMIRMFFGGKNVGLKLHFTGEKLKNETIIGELWKFIKQDEKSHRILDLDFDVTEAIEGEKDDKKIEGGYMPNMAIFEFFEKCGGVNKIIEVILKSLTLWKNKEKAKLWFAWVNELSSFSNLPHFFSLVMKNKECIELLFQLLRGTPDELESPDKDPKKTALLADQKKWDEENQKAVRFSYKILSDVFKIDNNAKIRDFALDKQLIDRFLDRIAIISKESGRKWVENIEEEKVDEIKSNEKVQSPKKEEDYAKKAIKKKGVGYASDNTGQNQKWNISEYHESKKNQSEQLQSLLNILETFLDFNDWKSPKRFYDLLACSALLQLIESAFRSGSLLDMSKDAELFISYLKITKLISRHKSLLPLLFELDPHYVPKQTESIYFLLNNLKELATIFKNCMTGETQETPETTVTNNLAKEILNTYEAVTAAISDLDLEDTSESESQMHDILSLPLPEAYRTLLKDLRFDYTNIKDSKGVYKHHYASFITGKANYVPPQTKMVRLAQELADLSTALPIEHTNSIFVRCDQSRVDVMKALIMGSADTPYSHGAYEYDIFFDDNYPNGAPKVNLETTGAGRVRFNPNLYSCGKVCLSLLGTWRGNATENWDPKLSTLLQVLVSLQSIIMTDDVYFNEPGYEGEAGTDEGERKNEAYSNIVRYCNIKFAMVDQLKNPSKGFEAVIRRHFYLKKQVILEEVNKWLKYAQVRETSYNGLVNDHNSSWCSQFKKSKDSYYTMLKEAIKELEDEFNKLPVPSIKDIQTKKTVIKKIKIKQVKESISLENATNLEEIDVSYEPHSTLQKVLDISDEKVKDRWSRYIGAMGLEAVAKQANASVLISGLGPLGIEISKNVVLSGVKRFALHDIRKTDYFDLSGQFFLNESDIGQNRADQSLEKLQQLNYYVKLDIFNENKPFPQKEEELIKIGLDQFNVVILTETDYDTQIAVDNFCRKRNIQFISADTNGAFGRVFLDLGAKFEVLDKNGEELQNIIIKTVTCEKEGKIETLEGTKHNLEDGDLVLITGVEGMSLKEGEKHPEPNQTLIKQELVSEGVNGTVHQVKIINKSTFTIGDTTLYGPYIRNGIAKQLKSPLIVQYSPLEEVLTSKNPVFDATMAAHDFLKLENQKVIHIAYEILDLFFKKKGYAPKPWDHQDAIEFLELGKSVITKYFDVQEVKTEEIDKINEFLAKFALTHKGTFGPLAAFLGGFVAQEVVKAITQKYKPINQLFYTDCIEILPKIEKDMTVKLMNDRFDGLKVCLGEDLVQKIRDCKLFMVGAGAIGCELLKNYAMLSLGTGSGKIILTDPDVIETSNLNRQFLFREKHLRKPKSLTAAAAAIQMNPLLKNHVLPRLDKVHEGTVHIFTDEFFESLNVVTNALDNIQARRYIDARCVSARTPMIESGTLGPKGHVQVVVPGKTESYGSQEDPQEEAEIPHCTLKMFPEETLHCVEWARDKFGKIFTQKPKSLLKLLDDPNVKPISSQEKKNLREAVHFLRKKPLNFDDCLVYARKKFQKYFVNDIHQLVYTYPLDHKTKQGTLFWTLPKRPPTPLEFTKDDDLYCNFISAFACLWGSIWGVPIPKDSRKVERKKEMGGRGSEVKVEKWIANEKKAKDIAHSVEKEEKEENKEEEAVEKEDDYEGYGEELLKLSKEIDKKNIKAEEFEKDNDENFHIDFIFSLANCRARNYKLDAMDWVTVKIKAGRIIPALATTTAAIAGLQTIELVKLIKECKVEDMKNAFLNLAVPVMQLSEPGSAPVVKLSENLKVTLWDRWEMKQDKNLKLKDFLDELRKTYGIIPRDVMSGSEAVYFASIYNIPGKEKDKEEILNKKIAELVGVEDEKYINLTVTFTKDENSNEILKGVPPIRIYFEEVKK